MHLKSIVAEMQKGSYAYPILGFAWEYFKEDAIVKDCVEKFSARSKEEVIDIFSDELDWVEEEEYDEFFNTRKTLQARLENLVLNSGIKILNRTPHPVIIVDESEEELVYFPACPKKSLIRLKQTVEDAGTINLGDGVVPLTKTVYTPNANSLPEENQGVFYIVSQLVKTAYPERTDLLVPAEVVRDDNGNIIGCRSLGV